MIVNEPDSKAPSEARSELPRAPSPPPPYVGSSTAPAQRREELPSAFRPPSPASFPHAHPHTNTTSSGPTPLFSPTAGGQPYAYYDPRSAYSLSLAEKRAKRRFWMAFTCAASIFVLLWIIGLLRFG